MFYMSRDYSKYWGYSGDPERQGPCKVDILVGNTDTTHAKIYYNLSILQCYEDYIAGSFGEKKLRLCVCVREREGNL